MPGLMSYDLAAAPSVGLLKADLRDRGINAKQLGAVGDGTSRPVGAALIGRGRLFPSLSDAQDRTGILDLAPTDELDWACLQWSINLALASGTGVYIPPGRFIVNRSLQLGYSDTRVPAYDGFWFRGAGIGSDLPDTPVVGTTFIHKGAVAGAMTDFLLVWQAARYRVQISDFTVVCGKSIVDYAIRLSEANNSQYIIERINSWGPKTFFCQDRVTGANGEFHQISNVLASDCEVFIENRCGQGLFWNVINSCMGSHGRTDLKKCVYLKMTGPSNGFGFTFTNCNSTFPNSNACESILVDATDATAWEAAAIFVGGRHEHVTTVLKGRIGLGWAGQLLLKGVQFAGMRSSDAFPVINCASAQAFDRLHVRIENCHFYQMERTRRWVVNIPKRFSGRVNFEGCFIDFERMKLVTSPERGSVYYNNCTMRSSRDNLETEHDHDEGVGSGREFMRRAGKDGTAIAGAGRPVNLLSPARPVSATGAGVPVADPWATFGHVQPTLNAAAVWGDPNVGDASESACSLVFRSMQGVRYVSTIPVNGSALGSPSIPVAYHALVRVERDTAFRLVNSTDPSLIYKEIVLKGTGAMPAEPTPISMTLALYDAKAAGFVALEIQAVQPGPPCRVTIDYHHLADKCDATFAPTAGEAVGFSQQWLSPRNLRPWSRLQLPAKTDAYGSASPRAIPDLAEGEIYYSTTQKAPVVRAGEGWGSMMPTLFGTAAPDAAPPAVGWMFLDLAGKKLYVATGDGSAGDWELLN